MSGSETQEQPAHPQLTVTLAPSLQTCPVIVALALMAVLSTAPRAAGADTIFCQNDYEQETVTISGFFLGREAGRKTRLFLNKKPVRLEPKPEGGCVIRHEDSDDVGINWVADYAGFEGVCLDVKTGRDHAIVHEGAGQYFDIQIWSADPVTGSPVLLYSEAWGDSVYPAGDDRWGLDLLVSADGVCRWRERQEAHQSFKAAMAALRIGNVVDANHPEFDLPTRPILAESVQHWLPILKNVATLEGAVYADDAGRNAWWVVQVLGKTLCDAEGVVLLFDRQRKSWQTIYDVRSGCSKVLNYPMRGMVVKGGQLVVSGCMECNGWGLYHDYSIDLRSYRATVIDHDSSTIKPAEDDNPIIHEFDHDIFLRSDP